MNDATKIHNKDGRYTELHIIGDKPISLTSNSSVLFKRDLTVLGNIYANTCICENVIIDTIEDKNVCLGDVKPGPPTDITANGGGLCLLGDTTKSIFWYDDEDSWRFNQDINLGQGRSVNIPADNSIAGTSYRIDGDIILTHDGLGDTVVNSNLAKVGELRMGSINDSKDIFLINNTNPAQLTVFNHNLITGDEICISGSNSTPNVDGIWEVTVLNENVFTVSQSVTITGNTGKIIDQNFPINIGISDLSSGTHTIECGKNFDVRNTNGDTVFKITGNLGKVDIMGNLCVTGNLSSNLASFDNVSISDAVLKSSLTIEPGVIINGILLVLPPPLQSIATLITSPNQMIYTIATDTYATTSLTAQARTFLAQTSVVSQQAILNLIPGSTIQPYSPLLSTFAGLTPIPTNSMIYTSGVDTFSVIPSASFGRSLVNQSSAATARTTLDVVKGIVSSTDNAIVRWDGTDGHVVQDSGILISDGDSISGVVNIIATGNIQAENIVVNSLLESDNITVTIGIDTPSIENSSGDLTVDGTVIPTVAWPFVATMDQNVASTSSSTFSSISLTTPITGLTPSSNAVTKSYVDSLVSGSGFVPIESVRAATTTDLTTLGTWGVITYTSPAETLTSSINGAIVIDGVALNNGDRVLIKDQSTNTENGVYDVTDAGSGATTWILTRASDFNQAATPITSNTFVFVEDVSGVVNSGTQWALESTVNDIDPLTDPVVFNQVGVGTTFSAGSGIDITGSVISVDKGPLLKFDGNKLDLFTPVAVSSGGTGVTSLTSGNVLIGNGIGAVMTTKVAPSGVFVGTTDIQSLTNKTITDVTNIIRATQLATTGADVVVSAGAPPISGQVLTAIDATTAHFADLPSFGKTVTVAKSGGDYTSLATALIDIAAGTAPNTGGVPSVANPITVLVYGGIYTESNPLIVPSYVHILGLSNSQGIVVIASDPTDNLFVFSGASTIFNIECRGVTTSGKAAFRVSSVFGSIAVILYKCIVRGCKIGFYSAGTGVPNTSIIIMNACGVVSMGAGTVEKGIFADAGGVIINTETAISGFFGGTVDHALETNDVGTVMINFDPSISFANSAAYVDSGSEMRIHNGSFGFFPVVGLYVGPGGSVGRFLTTFLADNTALFSSQKSIIVDVGASLVQLGNVICRRDIAVLPPSVKIYGTIISTTPGNEEELVLGGLSVGGPNNGVKSAFGQGESQNYEMTVFTFDASGAGFSANLASILKLEDGSTVTVFPSNTTGDIFYIGQSSTLGQFTGLTVYTTTAVVPAGGNSATLEPPSYRYVFEYWNGSWQQFRIMTTLDTSPHTDFRRDTFQLGTTNIHFDNIFSPHSPIKSTDTFVSSTSLWTASGTPLAGWTQTTVNGVFANWVRIRLITPLTTVPVIDRLKLQNNSLIVHGDGHAETYGTSRVRKRMYNIRNWVELNTTSTSDVLASDNIGAALQKKRFTAFTTNDITLITYLPDNIDTSHSIRVVWSWFGTSATAGVIRWVIRYAYTPDYAAVNPLDTSSGVYDSAVSAPTTSPTEYNITFNSTAPGINDKQVTNFAYIDVSDVLTQRTGAEFGDILWITISREGGNAADTYNGNCTLINACIEYVAKSLGQHTK
jgi:hypothetical protein